MNTPMILKENSQNLFHITMYSRKQKVVKTKPIASTMFLPVSQSAFIPINAYLFQF